jgi:LVIVD repeat
MVAFIASLMGELAAGAIAAAKETSNEAVKRGYARRLGLVRDARSRLVHGDTAYAAWRDAGMVVIDVSDRSNPRCIAIAWCSPQRRETGHEGASPAATFMPGNQNRPASCGCAGSLVDSHENVVSEAVEQCGDIGPPSAGVPDPVNAAALDRHETNLSRVVSLADVVHGEAGRPRSTAGRAVGDAEFFAKRAAVIGALVLELGGGEHVIGLRRSRLPSWPPH